MQTNATLSMKGYVQKMLPYIIALFIFVLFKLCVPHPWLSTDSWDYIAMSFRGDPLGHRPIGYATMLRYFHDMGAGHALVVYFQFVLFLIGAHLLLERLFELLHFNTPAKIITWCFTIYNPFVLYLSNFLTTDIVFAAITAIWLASLINSLLEEGKVMYLWAAVHFVCYYFLFALRFNALYYPAITLVAILIFKAPAAKKIAIFGISVMLVGGIVTGIERRAEELTGTPVFSALGSWATANNALHIYKTEDVEDVWTDEMSILHTMVVRYKDSIKYDGVTDAFMWNQVSPLKQYIGFKLQFTKRIYIKEYYAVAPLYRAFGMDLIKRYPMAFIRNFYIPNLQRCMAPMPEIFDFDEQSRPNLDSQAKEYIGLKDDLPEFTPTQVAIATALPVLYTFANIVSAIAALVSLVLYLKYRKKADLSLRTLTLLSCFHIATIALLAFAHPVWIRYLAFGQTFLVVIPIATIMVLLKMFSKATGTNDAVAEHSPGIVKQGK